MRIKIISHNRMKKSIDYLYDKLDNPDTRLYPSLSTCENSEEFFKEIYDRIDEQTDKINKSISINNTIKHLVLTFHPNDKSILPNYIDQILVDVFKELKIDPENHHMTGFEHNDRAHPHIHLAFSRIGVDGTIFDDQKLGWKINELAKEIEKKYSLTKALEQSPKKISIKKKYLYQPTKRGDLLKLINYGILESKSLTDFQKILKDHGVIAKKMEDGTINYITKDRVVYKESIMPKEARLKNLYTLIKTQKHSKEYTEFRNNLKNNINQCKTINDIKALFPDSKVKYQRDGVFVQNVTIDYNGMQIKINETILADIKTDVYVKSEDTNIPIIFVPYIENNHSFEENKQKRIDNKNKKKSKRLGFKVQI